LSLKPWYLALTRSTFIFLIEKEKLGNEPMTSASLPISPVLAPRLNILISDTSTDIGDLIVAEKEIRISKRGKK
jgi:hypothetical protein